MVHRIFVYGSLRRGRRAHRLIAHARFRGEARTVASFRLLDLGAYPGLVAGGTTSVVGEVYDIDDATLEVLDRFEDHPEMYRRTPVDLDDGRTVVTYLLIDLDGGPWPEVETGDWAGRGS